MSLAINCEKVTEVLLADGWHAVAKASFDLDAYDFLDGGDNLIFGGGYSPLVCNTGFHFKEWGEDSGWIAGPVTSILAIRGWA